MTLRRVLPLALAALALARCDMGVRIDPEGYRCDPGGECPNGFVCVDNTCRRAGGDKCAGVTCTQPPASTCQSSSTLRSFAGRCDAATGTCAYDPVDTVCAGGCANNACVDLCLGRTCTTPDPPYCVDASTLGTWSQTGTCNASTGQCAYTLTTVTCTNGCASGRCTGQDLCATVTCTTPPPATCTDLTTQHTFANPGTCVPGTGQCSYAATDTPCGGSAVCVSGACVPPSLTFSQVGPRVRFAITALDVAPGSSGDNIVAVGAGGNVSRWNGFTWTPVAGPTTADLNAVAFVTSSTAVMVGANRTAWSLRTGTGTLNALPNVPGSNTANLVSVYGRSESSVLIVDDTGGWMRMGSGASWTSGSFPSSSGPYQMASAYVDESGRERVGGLCGSPQESCVAYRNLNTSSTWFVDTDSGDSQGYTAVGGSFPVATSSGSEALVGKPNLELQRHSSATGTFSSVSPSPALGGAGVVGITAVTSAAVTRPVYVLSSAGTGSNGLFRLSQQADGGVTTEGPLVETFFGKESLSRNEATGVAVAETKTAAGVNNIFRRSVAVNDVLDLGEDFGAVTTDAALSLILATNYGDVAIRRAGSSVFSLSRGPYVMVKAAEGRNGTGVLLAGQDGLSTDGYLERFAAGTFTRITASAPGTTFTSVCRVSDTEAYAVGTGGAIFLISGTTATRQTSGVTADLASVDCPAPGVAVACGAGGTVLRLTGTTWAPAPSPGSMALTSCRLAGSTLFAAADGYFGRLDSGAAAWSSLTGRRGLQGLVAKGPNELYAVSLTGASASDIVRFDGNAWVSLLSVTEALGGGVQIGARVVFGGTDGAIVEGR